jgi:L-cysteine S-thiosulfotransferase
VTVIKASFRDQGIAKVDRLNQDLGQSACSTDTAPPDAVVAAIEKEALDEASAGQPTTSWATGAGERIAQSGRGMTWTDRSAATAGQRRQLLQLPPDRRPRSRTARSARACTTTARTAASPDRPTRSPRVIVEYTWGKLWNARLQRLLEHAPLRPRRPARREQLRHLMALLLDPRRPSTGSPTRP